MVNKKQEKNIKRGKKSRESGQRFELKVRKDLEEKGWVCDRWTNNVSDFPEKNINLSPGKRKDRKLIPAKPKFVFNPQLKRRIPIGMSSGFPDFLAFTKSACWNCVAHGFGDCLYQVIGVEVKSNGILDKQEKEKCSWLLKNNIFLKILIASKGKKRGEIKYEEFKK